MKKLINDGWMFVKLPAGSSFSDAEKATFEPVDLPHDWLIWQENDLYETADAWYRRSIELPEGHEPVVMVRFDGVYMDCDVLINGKKVCTHPYGYTAFDVPLTGELHPGINTLTVHIRYRNPNSRWYSGSGIYRDVTLVTLPDDHLIPDSLYCCENEENGVWTLSVSAETAGNGTGKMTCTLYDRDGNKVSEGEGLSTGNSVRAEMRIPGARTWSPDDPYLYTLDLKYGDQTETRKIGLRYVSVSPETGMTINGLPVRLKGVCLHHDLGCLGAAFHEKAARRQLSLMKDMGANAVRTSHNPPSSRFLDICDEMGMLVVDEAFDMWERPKTTYDYARFFPEWYKKDVASWVRRDRCHPCVIMWSVGNEIYDMHADVRGEEVTCLLASEVRQHDPLHRAYVTFGCNYMPWEGGQRCAEHVDIVGYNYGEKYYEKHHSLHPGWIIYGSETGSLLSSRGVYHFPAEQNIMSDADRQCSSLGNSNTSWGAESLAGILVQDNMHPFSLGQFLWSGIDYIGEPTPYHTRSCYFGQADTACFPKDSFYLIRCLWTELKMIHIGVSWDWNDGQMIDVPVITNCYEAELFLNGRSLGRKKTDLRDPERCLPKWKVPYVPGSLHATGYGSDGEVICEDECRTPGDTAAFYLECEDKTLLTDGQDITFVTVTATDREGNPVMNARDRIRVTVTGGGRLLGTDNGDSTDSDSYKSDSRRLFSGKLLLVIGSNKEKKDVCIRVTGNTGIAAELVIPVKAAPSAPGVSCLQKAFSRPMRGEVSARKLDIKAEGSTSLTPYNPECLFRFSVLPKEASDTDIVWQVTNASGIETPYVSLIREDDSVRVRASGDGTYYLRGLCCEQSECIFISQMEFRAEGFGSPALDPYTYISAGLYDRHKGEIGSGNEKGIAFARDGESEVGFSCVDFGKAGSDTIRIDIFALNSDPYDLEFCAARPGMPERRVGLLRYEKPSIWNVYQQETWKLKERLTGIQSLSFRMHDKVHMKGFVFEKQEYAFLRHHAASAETIYGDSYCRSGDWVTGIGNNVTMVWNDMDFGETRNVCLELEGKTPLPANTVSVHVRSSDGKETTSAVEFEGKGAERQRFMISVPGGCCSVAFVFLPGSSFDFCAFRFTEADAFRFTEADSWTEEKE